MSPRRTSARSYSGQLPTWYFVLYFGWTRDFMPKIVFVRASERQKYRQCVPEEQHSRTNDGMDSSRWCGIIVPVVKRPLRATAEEESRCNRQRSPLTSPSPCFKWRSRITRGVWMKSIG